MVGKFLILIFAVASANPAGWKEAPLEEMRALCAGSDTIACIKYKFMSFLDSVLQKDSYKLSDSVEVVRNEYRSNEVVSSRGEKNLEDNIKEYIQTHDVTFKLPLGETAVTVGARNLDNNELDFKLSFSGRSTEEARKSKLKKIIIPIVTFVLLKAITLIPLALGMLGLKAWNALQLSFFSFVISVALSVFQLCKKIAADNAHPQIAAHGPWEAAYNHYAARALDETVPEVADAQQIAYRAH